LGTAATTGLLYQPQMIGEGDCGGGMKIGRGNRSTRIKTCPSATLSTTNPTWLDPGSKPGRRGGKPATNRLSYGAAFIDSTCRNMTNVQLVDVEIPRIFCETTVDFLRMNTHAYCCLQKQAPNIDLRTVKSQSESLNTYIKRIYC
jgi:hypothetical protein